MKKNKFEFIIDSEFQSQIPALTDEEFQQLEENILSEGEVLSPLIVWGNILVDGHNRYKILQQHPEIPYTTRSIPCSSLTISVWSVAPSTRWNKSTTSWTAATAAGSR